MGRTSCRCVNWNLCVMNHKSIRLRRTSCRCVNWNWFISYLMSILYRRTSCRCVNWNMSPRSGVAVTPVAPRVGAWIEISTDQTVSRFGMRRTSCRCVNWNWYRIADILNMVIVAPRVGAWIEIKSFGLIGDTGAVAPRVGAWIEISSVIFLTVTLSSRTSCRCVNWNYVYYPAVRTATVVAPRVGAWIEMF